MTGQTWVGLALNKTVNSMSAQSPFRTSLAIAS